MKCIISILILLTLCLSFLALPASAASVITRVELTMDYPVAGKTPPTNCSIHGNGYTIHSIDWYENAGRGFLETGETFREGYTYKATVWVKASTGYEFSYADSRTPAITAYINGKEVDAYKAYEYNAWSMVCMDIEFYNIPAKGWIKNVNLTVPAPVAGEAPSYQRLTGTGYGTGDVSFSGSSNPYMENGIAWYGPDYDGLEPGTDTFGENTVYTFHCLICPTEGYKIREDATVYVNGKEAEAELDYDTFLTVDYDFPATGRITPTHTHQYSDKWSYNFGQHYKHCIADNCDEIFFVEGHKGGIATCEADGVCSVCGYAYIPAGEEYHVPDTSKWVARSYMYHFHPCTICGAHCDIEDHRWSPTYLYQDENGHAWICADCKAISEVEPHVAGPAGTPGAATVCRDCGYDMSSNQGHTHKLTLVEAVSPTCTEPGWAAYYTCSGCDLRFGDAAGTNVIEEGEDLSIAPLGHVTSDVWYVDGQYHWRICTACRQTLEETKMLHEDKDGVCSTCCYQLGSDVVTVGPSSQETLPAGEGGSATVPNETLPNSGGSGNAEEFPWVPLIILACFGAGVGVTVLILKKKK